MSAAGKEVHGVLNSADASAGVVVPMFEPGSDTALTLASNEFLDIDSCSIVTAAGGDAFVYFSTAAAQGTGKTILRGTFSANGGLSKNFNRSSRAGKAGESVWADAPSGACDVLFTGRITKI